MTAADLPRPLRPSLPGLPRRVGRAAAQELADINARAELDRAAALLDGVREAQAKLSGPPSPDAYGNARKWGHARDQHAVAASRLASELAEAEQCMNTVRDEHNRLLAEVALLREIL